MNSIIVTEEPNGRAAIWSRVDGVLRYLELHPTMPRALHSARTLVASIRNEAPGIEIKEVLK